MRFLCIYVTLRNFLFIERTLAENTLNFMISLLLVLTREKNPSVRTAGEYAIVSLLKLRENEQIMQVSWNWVLQMLLAITCAVLEQPSVIVIG